MDVRTGKIMEAGEILDKADARYVKQMALEPTTIQRMTSRVGRNDPCPCNSGKKFKRCCKVPARG